MTGPTADPDRQPLQFDQADTAGARPSGPTCAMCRRLITTYYFETAGTPVLAALVIGGAWLLSHQGLLLILLIVAILQAFRPAAPSRDDAALATYAALTVALTWLMHIPIGMTAAGD